MPLFCRPVRASFVNFPGRGSATAKLRHQVVAIKTYWVTVPKSTVPVLEAGASRIQASTSGGRGRNNTSSMKVLRADTASETLRTRGPTLVCSCALARSYRSASLLRDSRTWSSPSEPWETPPFQERVSISDLYFSLAAAATNRQRITGCNLRRVAPGPSHRVSLSKFPWL